jgi:enamine deaminase RidA (YjgF/YER057c/UK114 family)
MCHGKVRVAAGSATRRLLIVAIATGVLLPLGAHAQERRAFNPPSLPPANAYSHVVVAPKGRTVHISGQVGLDENGNLSGKDFEAQCVQAHLNIQRALASLGLDFDDVVRTDTYITDLKYLPVLGDVRKRFLPENGRPASTLLVVSGLFRPDLLVEVSVEAVLPDEQRRTPPPTSPRTTP